MVESWATLYMLCFVKYVTKLKSDRPKKQKIVVCGKSKPNMVFREKRRLKGKTICLTEDLTVTKAKSTYLA